MFGTSIASPYALRSAVAVKAQLGKGLNPLAIRALLVHRAESGNETAVNVGWGKFETDYDNLITCEDDEALVVFQGELPIKDYLRVPLPLPEGTLVGSISVTATLVISPEVDPEYPNVYTRGGLEVTFRPNSAKFKPNKDGTMPKHPQTKSFFSSKNIYGVAEYELRDESHKWEPCLKATQKYRESTLFDPCFDIYYHKRGAGTSLKSPKPMPYAFIVTVKAPKIPDFYDRMMRTYSQVLVPLQPSIRIKIAK